MPPPTYPPCKQAATLIPGLAKIQGRISAAQAAILGRLLLIVVLIGASRNVNTTSKLQQARIYIIWRQHGGYLHDLHERMSTCGRPDMHRYPLRSTWKKKLPCLQYSIAYSKHRVPERFQSIPSFLRISRSLPKQQGPRAPSRSIQIPMCTTPQRYLTIGSTPATHSIALRTRPCTAIYSSAPTYRRVRVCVTYPGIY